MTKIFKCNKKYFIILGIILLIGFCSGIIYYNLLDVSIKDSITYSISNYNNLRYNSIIKDLLITSLLLVTSFFIIGIPLALFYFFYEGLSLGFIFNIFIINFKFNGFVYFLIYIIINKLLILLLMTVFIKKTISISRYIICLIIYKRDQSLKNKLICTTKNSIYIIIFILIMNSILYFVTPYIFNHLIFLLKE